MVLTAGGEPGVESSAAIVGLGQLADDVDAGVIPEATLSWSEADAVREFAKGNLVFLRGWATAGAEVGAGGSNRVSTPHRPHPCRRWPPP